MYAKGPPGSWVIYKCGPCFNSFHPSFHPLSRTRLRNLLHTHATMRSLIALVLLGQILGCTAVPAQLGFHLHKLVPCDDPEVQDAAEFALQHINAHTLHGYKYIVNRVEDVKVIPGGPEGKTYFYIELDLLETICHVLSPVPASKCEVRARHHHAVEADCNVKLLKHAGGYKVLKTHCHSTPDSVEDLQKLYPDSRPLLPLNDARVVSAANTALAHFNAENNTIHFQLLEISRGQSSHLPPASHVEFAIVQTNCTAQDAHDHPEDCKPLAGELARFGFCHASIFDPKNPVQQAVPPVQQAVPPVQQDVPPAQQDVPPAQQDVPPVQQDVPPAQQDVPPAQQDVPPAQQDVPPAQQAKDEVHCSVYGQQVGLSHTHLTEHHLGKNIPSPGVGQRVLSLIHSHNDTHASHESHSAEAVVPVVQPVVKRAAGTAPPLAPTVGAPVLPMCPGKIRFFKLD